MTAFLTVCAILSRRVESEDSKTTHLAELGLSGLSKLG